MKDRTDSVFIVSDDCTEIRPFISPTDNDEVRELKQRYIYARRHAVRGRVENPVSAMLAGAIDYLRLARQRQQTLSPARRKILIKDQEAWLAPALLEAAEQGILPEVAHLLDRRRNGEAILNRGQYELIEAYGTCLALKERPPFIGELLKQLHIEKPKRSKENMQLWFRLNSRERVIRETLKRFNLPLSRAKRGRH